MKKKPFDISHYVIYDPLTNKSQCLYPNCGKLLSGKRNANIRRHYMLMHGTSFSEYGPEENEAADENDSRSNAEFILPQYSADLEQPGSSRSTAAIKIECVTLPTLAPFSQEPSATQKNSEACRLLTQSTTKSAPTQRLSEPYATHAALRRREFETRTPQFELSEPYSTEMAKLDEKVGFIGGGNMAFAIGSGLISRGIVKPGQVLTSGPNLENLTRWRDLGAEVTEDNYEVLDKSDVIFICVKPHILTPCATQLRSIHEPTTKDKEKLFVSVLAGVNLKTLEESFNFIVGLKMIRTMPNTSMQVGEGCTVYTAGTYVKQQDLEKVHLMLNSLGIAQQVPESMIDAVTGLAGCGPAYVYTFIESLADGAVKMGVPRQMALQFAAQTVLGAAKTVLMTAKHPAVLRDEVCSPGGSTIVGVHELEKGNFRATVINAVEMSSKRSAELGKK